MKIKFKDLTWFVKIPIVITWIVMALYGLAFIVGVVIGATESI